MTYNILDDKRYYRNKIGNTVPPSINDFIQSRKHKPHIICTQEEPNKKITITDYSRLKKCPNEKETPEDVAVYYHKDIPSSKIEFLKCIEEGRRHAIIFQYNNIKIANLHLDGGRFTDQELHKNYNERLEIKLKLLEAVIKETPDIIVGDFNSVYSTNSYQLNKFLKGQYNYFKKINFVDKSEINEWNSEPYETLKNKSYIYAKPSNEINSVTNFRGDTIVDTIWYKNNKVKLFNTNIIDTFDKIKKCATSDHNPVMTTVSKKLVNKQTKKKNIQNEKKKKRTYKSNTITKLNYKKFDINKTFPVISNLDFIKEIKNLNNYRIFLLLAHGSGTKYDKITTGNKRLNLGKITNIYKRNEKNISIITTQPFGRLSPLSINNIFIKPLTNTYNKVLYKGLINMENRDEIRMMNYYTTSLYIHQRPNYIQKGYARGFIRATYPKDPDSISYNIITNYQKYNYKNKIENTELSIVEDKYGGIQNYQGIFEITSSNLINDITKNNKNYGNKNITVKQQMFLFDKFYGPKYNDLLKYNKELCRLYYNKGDKKLVFNVEKALNVIYSEGNIKENDKVIIIATHCRGLNKEYKSGDPWNNKVGKNNKNVIKEISKRRKKSQINMLDMLKQL